MCELQFQISEGCHAKAIAITRGTLQRVLFL